MCEEIWAFNQFTIGSPLSKWSALGSSTARLTLSSDSVRRTRASVSGFQFEFQVSTAPSRPLVFTFYPYLLQLCFFCSYSTIHSLMHFLSSPFRKFACPVSPGPAPRSPARLSSSLYHIVRYARSEVSSCRRDKLHD